MYLSRLNLNPSRLTFGWLSNPYRVHQRLMMACGSDPRMLFRIEGGEEDPRILVQTQQLPDWPAAFAEFPVLARAVEIKAFDLKLAPDQTLRFCLLANPVVKRAGRRLGLLTEEKQRAWLERKLKDSGAELLACRITPIGLQHSRKKGLDEEPVHLQIMYEGLLQVQDNGKLAEGVAAGIGPAKGFGCGLLSLARAA